MKKNQQTENIRIIDIYSYILYIYILLYADFITYVCISNL